MAVTMDQVREVYCTLKDASGSIPSARTVFARTGGRHRTVLEWYKQVRAELDPDTTPPLVPVPDELRMELDWLEARYAYLVAQIPHLEEQAGLLAEAVDQAEARRDALTQGNAVLAAQRAALTAEVCALRETLAHLRDTVMQAGEEVPYV
jgi:hypothetical protein